MANKSFGQRYPAFKWVVLASSLIMLFLTVISVQTVSTNIRQEAAGFTCGPNNLNPKCPAGYACSYIQGNPTFGGTCYTLATPTGLYTDARICKVSGTEYDFFDFNWKAVSGASKYRVYYKIYGTSTYSYKDTTYTHQVVTSYKNLNGRHIQWYVKASNEAGAYSTSSVYITGTPKLDCYWMTTP